MADARSAGGLKAHGPASCIAPYPDRLTCLWPSGNVDIKRPSSQGRRGGPYESFAVAPVAELVGKRWMARMPAAPSTRRSIGSFHDTIAGAWKGDSSVMEELAP